MTDSRFAHEHRLTILARHGQSVRRRWAFGFVGLAVGIGDAWLDYFPSAWYVSIVPSLILLALNAWCVHRVRTDRVRVPHFWMMLVADVVLIAATAALAGPAGPDAMPFYIAVAAAYGLGLPGPARVHLALSGVCYPIARVLGGGQPSSIVLETGCLIVVSWLSISSPMRFTYRLSRARRALAALEQGDFTVRLPERSLDDLGFLAVSFNRTAEALGAAVEELQRSREALAHQAHHDPLTGLANRVRFHERLRRALASERAERVGVLVIDLDGFKDVNDRLGHAAGDQLLSAVAERLLDATRGRDTVARIGGDEFAVLLENVDQTRDAEVVAERIVAALQLPFDLSGTPAHIGASVGIARHTGAPALDGAVEDPGDILVRRADLAMYAAKAGGKGRWVVHDPRAGVVPERALGSRWMLV